MSSSSLPSEIQSILLETLINGNVDAYTNLFYLVSRPRTSREDHGDTLPFIQQIRKELVTAEEATHAGTTAPLLASTNHIGKLYADVSQPSLSIYYYEKVLHIAQSTKDSLAEMNALYALGIAYEAIREYTNAVKEHEAHRTVATKINDHKEIIKSNTSLLRVYSIIALQYEQNHKFTDSLHYYTLALEASKQANDERAEGKANHSVGRACILAGNAHDSIPYLQTFLRIAKNIASNPRNNSNGKDDGAVGQAYAALAAAYQTLGDHAASSQCLQELLDISIASGNDISYSKATENIGIMHAAAGRRSEAEPYLQKAFELRRKLVQEGKVSRNELDQVRILLGMVRSEARVQPLLDTVAKIDILSLLNWRLQRTELQGVTSINNTSINSSEQVSSNVESGEGSTPVATSEETITTTVVAETTAVEGESKNEEGKTESSA